MISAAKCAIAANGRLKSAVEIKAKALISSKAFAFDGCNRSMSVSTGSDIR